MDDWKWVSDLYREDATSTLFHYTSIAGAMAIVRDARLFATELRYLNDMSEGRHFADLIAYLVTVFLQTPVAAQQTRMLRQFHPWVTDRMSRGHMVFASSFTTRGDQLSQWRGYCPAAKGVSLGFDPKSLRVKAEAQSFELARCIYDRAAHEQMTRSVVTWLLLNADQETLDPSKRHPDNSFHDLFESVEGLLLRLSALIKHPAFEEEQEWRVVSAPHTSYRPGTPICYREGVSMLAPFLYFELPRTDHGTAALETVVVGPTPHPEAACESVRRFLYGAGSNPRQVRVSAIPYRTG